MKHFDGQTLMVLTFPNLPNGYFRYLGPEKSNGKVAYASTIFLMSELIYEIEYISKNPYSTIKLLHKTIPSVFSTVQWKNNKTESTNACIQYQEKWNFLYSGE